MVAKTYSDQGVVELDTLGGTCVYVASIQDVWKDTYSYCVR